jgi:hypothetical protein
VKKIGLEDDDCDRSDTPPGSWILAPFGAFGDLSRVRFAKLIFALPSDRKSRPLRPAILQYQVNYRGTNNPSHPFKTMTRRINNQIVM